MTISSDDADRIPVIVGVGQLNDRPATPEEGLDPIALMVAALRIADEDAGGGWLAAVESLGVVDQISFRDLNPVAEAVATGIEASPRLIEQTAIPSGDSPIHLLHDAANRIGAGEITVAAVVGGEALRTAAQRAAAAAGSKTHDLVRANASRRQLGLRQRYGLVTPTDIYPLYENACRAAWGQSLDEGQNESAAIWALFSQVAEANPGAWIRKPTPANEIAEPSASNRRIAFPYNKLMVANSSVNQGAGFIVTSLAEARRRGVPEDRLVYVGQGAASHESEDPLARDKYSHSAGMETSIRKTLELNGVTANDLDLVELYSCFPCVPKMARRVLGWPLNKPATVFGGLTFGGGPIGNYMSHAVVSMVEKLRQGGRNGLLFANGGFATHNHTILLTRAPVAAGTFPQPYDYQAEADSRREASPEVLEDYRGPGTIETYTVIYDRTGAPSFGVVVARNPAGQRCLARVPASDEATIAFLTSGLTEPVGSPGEAVDGDDGLAFWKRADQ